MTAFDIGPAAVQKLWAIWKSSFPLLIGGNRLCRCDRNGLARMDQFTAVSMKVCVVTVGKTCQEPLKKDEKVTTTNSVPCSKSAE